MAQAYLVGHGGALSPNTPGGDPVGNYLEKAIAVDNQRLRAQQSESYARQTQTAEKAQRLKSLRDQYELVGSKSPTGKAIRNELLGELGVQFSDSSVDDDTVSSILDNGMKSYDKTFSDTATSTEDKQVWLFHQINAMNEALARTGGTETERKAAAASVEGFRKSAEDTLKEQRRAGEYDRREGVRQSNRIAVKASPGAPRAPGAVGTTPGERAAWTKSNATYTKMLGALVESTAFTEQMTPEQQDAAIADLRIRSNRGGGVYAPTGAPEGEMGPPTPIGTQPGETGLDSPVLEDRPLPEDPAERATLAETLGAQLLEAGFPPDKAAAELLRRGFKPEELPE